MKRKLECPYQQGRSNFFKKGRIEQSDSPVTVELTLEQKLIEAAMQYEGRLNHIPSNNYYVSWGLLSATANDFLIHFCDSLAELPTYVKQVAAEKFTSITPVYGRTEFSNTFREDPYLCCWEFCFLALKDAGVVSEKQLDDLCYIVYKINEANRENDDMQITLATALFESAIENYTNFSSETMPSPGDLLLFKKIDSSQPYHANICIDSQGGYIGLGDLNFVTTGNIVNDQTLKKEFKAKWNPEEDFDEWVPGNVFYIPVSSIAQNIECFIDKNMHILALKYTESKINETVLIENFRHTQYSDLVEEQLMEIDAENFVNAVFTNMP